MKTDHRYLAFTLNKDLYAIPLMGVKEVIGLTEITPVPETPSYFKGLLNLRGQVISTIDLRTKFKITPGKDASQTAIIILDLPPLSLGMIVDSVDTVLSSLTENDISPAIQVNSEVCIDYISGVAKRDKDLILLLDVFKALSLDDLEMIKKQSNQKTA